MGGWKLEVAPCDREQLVARARAALGQMLATLPGNPGDIEPVGRKARDAELRRRKADPGGNQDKWAEDNFAADLAGQRAREKAAGDYAHNDVVWAVENVLLRVEDLAAALCASPAKVGLAIEGHVNPGRRRKARSPKAALKVTIWEG